MNDEIFNLENIQDIPDTCKRELNIQRLGDGATKLLNLFKIKNTLSIDEIIVALYRLYKVEKSRSWVSSTLYNLGRKNLVKKINGERLYEVV